MIESLNAHSSDFQLYVFAFDELTYEILLEQNLNNVTVVSLKEFETNELQEVKNERSKAEYCWTCTPSIISYVLDKYKVADCTYIDSDLFFYSDPAVLISELNKDNKNVLITEHRFSYLAGLYEENRAGRFCVQFLTFLNEKSSLDILDKWRNQCISWCYAKYEDGKFGDQKYLDEWPSAYPNIHILQHHGGGIAPWNLQQYSFLNNGSGIKGIINKTGSEFDVIFYHFQYVKFLENGSYDIGWYLIPRSIKKLFYLPYLKKLEEIEERLCHLKGGYFTQYTYFKADNIKNILKKLTKKTLGYNMIKTK